VRRAAGVSAAAAALALALSTPVLAQPGTPQTQWMGAMIGAHVGVDYLFEGFLIGGQGHLLLDPWGRVSLIPSAEYEIRRGLRDWQANLDAAVMPIPGVYVGGGLSYRNSIFEEEVGRETLRGYSVFVGYRAPPAPGRFVPQIELRWSFIGDIRPRMLTAGVNYPLLLFR
jgi:hypothetical protein